MTDISKQFINAYFEVFPNKTVWTESFPAAMKASEKDADGWIGWKPIRGTLTDAEYADLEKKYAVVFPKSFIAWHKSLFFLDADCSIIRLPASNPKQPLREIEKKLDWFIGEQLIAQKLYPFADEGNDTGPLVFDGRLPREQNEFPIRVYDHEFGGDPEGLSEIIFSSFTSLLECTIHYLRELKTKKSFEIIPGFFEIDPDGAGKTGVDYWLAWANMQKANYNEM